MEYSECLYKNANLFWYVRPRRFAPVVRPRRFAPVVRPRRFALVV